MSPVEMIDAMVSMHDAHNSSAHADWMTRGFQWHRGLWTECAEVLDHYGWKWWKAQPCDLGQVRLELADIWLFGLSDLMTRDGLDELADLPTLVNENTRTDPESFLKSIEGVAYHALRDRVFSVPAFAHAMSSLPISWEQLFCAHIGKNALKSIPPGKGLSGWVLRQGVGWHRRLRAPDSHPGREASLDLCGSNVRVCAHRVAGAFFRDAVRCRILVAYIRARQ